MEHRAEIEKLQLQRLQTLVEELREGNRFYQQRLDEAGVDGGISSLAAFSQAMPFTSKAEIERDRELVPPYGSNLTYPPDQYSRLYQSSGTSGAPLVWQDTRESWAALLDCWDEVYRAAGVGKADLVFFAFSFGPFLGFWTAFESATRSGIPVLPGGGMSSVARLRAMALHGATVLCCTPTYALRLGEVLAAEREDEKLSGISVRKVIVGGEPGGSSPQIRERLEHLWAGARVFDHHGMTEVGPVSYERLDWPMNLCVIEEAYYAEVVDRKTLREVAVGEKGELVLTTLRRTASPLLRYRTGDLVEKGYFLDESGTTQRKILCLEGGILGRVDEMVVVRGINIYPTAIESIVLGFPEVAEYQVIHSVRESMDELEIAIEPVAGKADDTLEARVGRALSDTLTLRIPVKRVEPGSLPRFEFKARRWVKP